jgi:hypothetical protein
VLDRAVPLRIGVIGSATQKILSKFFETLEWPAHIQVFPLDMSADFRRHTRSAQKRFAQTLTNETGIGVWIGGVGERIQLALPQCGMLPRGSSDAIIARLLIKHDPNLRLVRGWLFPQLGQPLPREIVQPYEGCRLTAASLRSAQNGARIIGFDGRGAIAFPILPTSPATKFGIAYPDALMALAHLLPILSRTFPADLEALLPPVTLGYRLMSCPDKAKAYLMRQLVEAYDYLDLSFSDGIRLEEKQNGATPNWVVVRPCAGMQALEIYWEENGRGPSLNASIRRSLARWRGN